MEEALDHLRNVDNRRELLCPAGFGDFGEALEHGCSCSELGDVLCGDVLVACHKLVEHALVSNSRDDGPELEEYVDHVEHRVPARGDVEHQLLLLHVGELFFFLKHVSGQHVGADRQNPESNLLDRALVGVVWHVDDVVDCEL